MFQDDASLELARRYQMDSAIWKKSQRTGFPYSMTLNQVILLSSLTPAIFFVIPTGNYDLNYSTLQILLITLIISGFAFYLSDSLIERFKDTLCSKGLFGKDLNKSGDRESKEKVPEGTGVCIAIVFLLVTINEQLLLDITKDKLVEYNAALLSICMVVLLGFIDDVVDLRWAHKLVVPTVASFPLLVAYNGITHVLVPSLLSGVIGAKIIDLGALYYIYMGSLAVFCTNTINIYAGINGIEVGQSFIIGCFICTHNVIEMRIKISEETYNNHLFSLTLMIPFLLTTLALLKKNSFPSKVFVGDTFCYFAGMTFAVVCILGHFSKTMLLFFIPQLINFVLSIPQLIGVVHCPRHRLPKFNPETYQLHCVDNHYTLINAFLRVCGPTNEQQACTTLLLFQFVCCVFGLLVRYNADLLYY